MLFFIGGMIDLKKIKLKFDTYNDGVLIGGHMFSNMVLMKKEYIKRYRLCFETMYLSHSDNDDLNVDSKISLKVRVPRMNLIDDSKDIIEINNRLYSVSRVDHGERSTYLYLSDYIDDMTDIVEVYRFSRVSSLDDITLKLINKAFCKIETKSSESAIVYMDYNDNLEMGSVSDLMLFIKNDVAERKFKVKSIYNKDMKCRYLIAEVLKWELE